MTFPFPLSTYHDASYFFGQNWRDALKWIFSSFFSQFDLIRELEKFHYLSQILKFSLKKKIILILNISSQMSHHINTSFIVWRVGISKDSVNIYFMFKLCLRCHWKSFSLNRCVICLIKTRLNCCFRLVNTIFKRKYLSET